MDSRTASKFFGDGALGHQHTRTRCADVIENVIASALRDHGNGRNRDDAEALIDALRGEESDDAPEEYEAIVWLNKHAAVDGASWGWEDGSEGSESFGLWVTERDASGNVWKVAL